MSSGSSPVASGASLKSKYQRLDGFLQIEILPYQGDPCTLMCLNIGTPKSSNFPFVPNGKLELLGVLRLNQTWVHHKVIIMVNILDFKRHLSRITGKKIRNFSGPIRPISMW